MDIFWYMGMIYTVFATAFFTVQVAMLSFRGAKRFLAMAQLGEEQESALGEWKRR